MNRSPAISSFERSLAISWRTSSSLGVRASRADGPLAEVGAGAGPSGLAGPSPLVSAGPRPALTWSIHVRTCEGQSSMRVGAASGNRQWWLSACTRAGPSPLLLCRLSMRLASSGRGLSSWAMRLMWPSSSCRGRHSSSSVDCLGRSRPQPRRESPRTCSALSSTNEHSGCCCSWRQATARVPAARPQGGLGTAPDSPVRCRQDRDLAPVPIVSIASSVGPRLPRTSPDRRRTVPSWCQHEAQHGRVESIESAPGASAVARGPHSNAPTRRLEKREVVLNHVRGQSVAEAFGSGRGLVRDGARPTS